MKVSLVVCDPSEVLYSTLGHAALHLQCPIFDLDYIFSYESENVRDKIWTFLRGKLKMGLFAFTPEDFLISYKESGRGVREYTMNLDPEQEQKLWEVLDNHVMEGANIPYDYFHRGCAKAVVQVVHEAIGPNAIHYAPWPDKYAHQTMREIVHHFVIEAPWQAFIMHALIGIDGDKNYPCEQKLIVPTDLVEVWQQATLDNGKKVIDAEPRILLEPTRQMHGTWCTPLLVGIVLVFLALCSLALNRTENKIVRVTGVCVDYAVLAITTLIGVMMTYLILFSGLPCTNWHWLIIPFNILPAIGWYWRRYWALLYVAVILLWCIVMTAELLWGHLLVDWPHILFALAFAIVLIKQRRP